MANTLQVPEYYANLPQEFFAYKNQINPRTWSLNNSELNRIRNIIVLEDDYVNKINSFGEFGDKELKDILKIISDAKELCTEDVLSLDGITLRDEFEEIEHQITLYMKDTTDFTDSLRTRFHTYKSKQEEIYQSTIKFLNNQYYLKKIEVENNKVISGPAVSGNQVTTLSSNRAVANSQIQNLQYQSRTRK